MPDELTSLPEEPPPDRWSVAGPPTAAAADPPEAPLEAARQAGHGGRRARPPSWPRALIVSLAVVAAGFALGAVWYRLERTTSTQPPNVTRTADGWRITARRQREFSGLGLSGTRLLWQNGASIEYLDLASGRLRLLGPGPGMRTTWDPAVGDRYAVWFEAERIGSLAARAVAYDTRSGRRWTLAEIGSVRSYPAISGDVAVWCSAAAVGSPTVNGARIGSGATFTVAPGDGAPVVSGGLVVWAASWTGPFYAHELASGTSRPVTADLTNGRLTGLALAGRTLVWGQSSRQAPASTAGVVAAVDVDEGDTTTLASGVAGLSGPAYDGRTVVWGERATGGDRVMGRRLSGGPAFFVAAAGGTVKEVAVSGDTVAWIAATGASGHELVVTRLPR